MLPWTMHYKCLKEAKISEGHFFFVQKKNAGAVGRPTVYLGTSLEEFTFFVCLFFFNHFYLYLLTVCTTNRCHSEEIISFIHDTHLIMSCLIHVFFNQTLKLLACEPDLLSL